MKYPKKLTLALVLLLCLDITSAEVSQNHFEENLDKVLSTPHETNKIQTFIDEQTKLLNQFFNACVDVFQNNISINTENNKSPTINLTVWQKIVSKKDSTNSRTQLSDLSLAKSTTTIENKTTSNKTSKSNTTKNTITTQNKNTSTSKGSSTSGGSTTSKSTTSSENNMNKPSTSNGNSSSSGTTSSLNDNSNVSETKDSQLETKQSDETSSQSKTKSSPNYKSGTFELEKENEFLNLLNEYRKSLNLTPFSLNTTLQDTSRTRSYDIAQSFSHTRPNGSSPFTLSSKIKAENISKGYSTAQSAFNGFKSSAPHNKNMTNASYTTIGISCYKFNNKYFWVIHFGK